MAPLDVLYGIAEESGLEVLEDAGESLGARFGNSRLGRSPCACVFRLPLLTPAIPSHAALVTLPHTLAQRFDPLVKTIRLGDGAAEVARRQLESWEDRLAARRANASCYSSNLVRYDAFQIPSTPEDALPVYSNYLLRVTRFSRVSADDLYKLLKESGIETRRVALPLSERSLVRLPVTEGVRSDGILLPADKGLTEMQREHVLDTIFGYAIG